MNTLQQYMALFLVLIWHFRFSETYPQSGLDLVASRTGRHVGCRMDQEYPNGNICCLNCPAGTRTASPCSSDGRIGQCEECDDGTFTEHGNGLKHCFKCTQCRRDQEIVRACTHTEDAECRCRLGGFCDPDQACEVCKKCSSCEEDEEIVRNCTSTANTECKKTKRPNTVSAPAKVYVIVPIVLGLTVCAAFVIAVVWWKRRRTIDSQINVSNRLKPGPEDEPFPKLVPVNGEESLRKCFEYFEEIDYNYHKRFFRHLEINENVIRSKEHLLYEDKIHELLNIWVEKKGREGSLNDLLKALLDLNQRRTAETVKEKAVMSGHYVCDDK
ncbi:hematopoietic death receptor [Centropristis striata]|uniref:hematopoietic death receptor n=1 Tax=Centropristis striata TaxID=184440 RepID=UPI0027DF52C4|nr:hematopoietic death receptor [Centropristis striata]